MSECFPVRKEKLNLFTKIILSTMLIFLSLFPFGLAAFRMLKSHFGHWDGFTLSIMGIAVGLLFIFCISIMLHTDRKMSKSQVWNTCIGLFALSMSLRILCSYLLQSEPISDFYTGYQYATADSATSSEYLGQFIHLGSYALLLKTLFSFFPESVLTAQVFNALILSFIPIFLFLGIRKMIGNDKPAIAGAILYTLCPSMTIYSSILSCENVSQIFVALFLLIYAYWASAKSNKNKFLLSIILGFTMGLLNLFKPIMIIFSGAIAMACFCYQVIPAIQALIKKEEKTWKTLFNSIIHILLVIAVAAIVYDIGEYVVQMEVMGKTIKSDSFMGKTIFIGLYPETNGLWDEQVIATVNEVMSLYPNENEATSILAEKLVNLYQEDNSLLWTVQLNKLWMNWCQEACYYYWTIPSEPILQGTLVGSFLFESVPDLFATALYLFCSLGMIILFIQVLSNRPPKFVVCQSLFVCVGCVFLFVLMLMLIETQGRYKSNIMPHICCLGGIGMWLFFDAISQGRKKVYSLVQSKTHSDM